MVSGADAILDCSGFEMPDDDLVARKEALMEREGLSLHEHSVRRGPLSRRLLATLRLCLSNAAELAAYEAGARPEEASGSVRLEREVYTTVRVTLDGLLSELQEAHDEGGALSGDDDDDARDPEVLEDSDQGTGGGEGGVTETRRLALAYRGRYEEVLMAAQEEVERAVAQL